VEALEFLNKNMDGLGIALTAVTALVGGGWAFFKYRKSPSTDPKKPDSTDRSGGLHIDGGIHTGNDRAIPPRFESG
jgi:hypothetical protein